MNARVQKKEDPHATAGSSVRARTDKNLTHAGHSAPSGAMNGIDRRPAAALQRMLQNAANSSPQSVRHRTLSDMAGRSARSTAQLMTTQLLTAQGQEPQQQLPHTSQTTSQQPATANRTGLPDQLKAGIENLSGMPMDHVRVHYNSSQPAQLNALAYAQGNQIHVGPGQERHLPHEAWHVVQQAQGRVSPTVQAKGVPVNDDHSLEHEADVMGAKALQTSHAGHLGTAVRQAVSSGSSVPVQCMPDKGAVYLKRIRRLAGPPGVVPLPQHLEAYITNAAHAVHVGAVVAAAVNNMFHPPMGVAPALTMVNLTAAVNLGLAPQVAAPGQYAADTAFNAQLTQELEANPFIQSVMDGTLHSAVSGQRGTVPMAGAIPAPAAGTDDRVLEATDVFNRLTNLPAPLPPVNVNPISAPHAAMGGNGQLDLGWAAARGNLVHEMGHHLENNLAPLDLLTLHNFLGARTRVPPGGMPGGAMGGMRDAGYFFEHHPGYDIDMPKINAGGLKGRKTPQTLWQHVKHIAGTPLKAIEQVAARAWHATPLRYLGLIGSGLFQQAGRLASAISGRREPRNWTGKGVENFFVHNANNRQLSYSTANHQFNTPAYNGSTEYLSTTVEFFNRPSHARELVRVDPLRVALFLYLSNRPQYMAVRGTFNLNHAPANLDHLIHIVQ